MSGWTERQKSPRVLKEDGSRICWDGLRVDECEYDHSRCANCEKEFEDCSCHLDSERVEHMRSQIRLMSAAADRV